jgi:RecA-family ATPase
MTEGLRTFEQKTRFVSERFDDIEPRGEEYIVKGRIPAHGVGFLVGPSGALKTFLALDLALKIADGKGVLDGRTRKGGVVYVPAEAPNGCRKRVKAWRQFHSAKGLPFRLIPQAPDLRRHEDLEALAYAISLAAEEFGDFGLAMIVIDTLAASIPGADENGAADMSMVMSNARWLADETGAFVLIVTHTGKEEARGIRGWSGLYAAADMVITMTRSDGADVATGRLTKLKEGESGYRFSTQLEQIELGVAKVRERQRGLRGAGGDPRI